MGEYYYISAIPALGRLRCRLAPAAAAVLSENIPSPAAAALVSSELPLHSDLSDGNGSAVDPDGFRYIRKYV